ncbi:hypothetical protein Droror1_Dr00024473 [Drosera rotundifolia]
MKCSPILLLKNVSMKFLPNQLLRRSVIGGEASSSEGDNHNHLGRSCDPPLVRRGKLVMLDLAGSERVHKSGSEGHTLEEAKSINLSLYLEKERTKCQMEYLDSIKKLEEKWMVNQQDHHSNGFTSGPCNREVAADGEAYHKSYFRCSHGRCVISPSNYITHEHRFYYRHHHSQLFKQRGTSANWTVTAFSMAS